MFRLMSDNITGVSYVNGKGGIKSECNEFAKELWVWCTPQSMWVSVAHIPGTQILRKIVFLEISMMLLSGN